MQFSLKKLVPHIIAVVVFVVVSLVYFNPVLQGKKIYQSDIVQYKGMSKEQQDFRDATGEEPYWTDAAFAGMPTYQLGAKYPNNWIKKLDLTIRFLPRPADYLFLYFIGFYILLLSLRLDWRYAGLGALAFGFSTYLIIIIGVGHNAKAHAIAYMPLVLAGIVLTFRKKYIVGFIVTAFALALELVANHFQMTYYLFLLVLVLGIAYLIDAFRKKELPHFAKSIAILFIAALLALGTNATNLLATREYQQFSTRGKSIVSINPDGTPIANTEAGLDKAYINQYSYGITETLDLFVAGLFGGSNSEPYNSKSELVSYLRKQQVPSGQIEQLYNQLGLYYWGDQPIVSGPAYIGAVVIFLFVIGLFLVKGRLKWWLVGGTSLSLLLSYGKNLSWFTDLWIDYFPLYDKFRAVTSVQVIAELCIPVLAVFGLMKMLQRLDDTGRMHALKWATGITGGLALILLLFKNTLFNFSGGNDAYLIQNFGLEFVSAIKEDRKALYNQDVIKTLILILLTAGVLFAYLKGKLKETPAIVLVALFIVFDLAQVDSRYVNKDNFVPARVVESPFQATPADQQILKDTTRYRVYEERIGLNGARTSFFHNSIGGYHGAKPRRLQDIAEFYLYQGKIQPLNILNVKYIIRQREDGEVVQQNPYTNGNAWFVDKVKLVPDANSELLALDSVDTKSTAIVHQEFEDILTKKTFSTDSLDQISLVAHKPNYLKYTSSAKAERLALFSEAYYPNGWNAYIDGKPTTYFRADYMIRAMLIPAGNHVITFAFEPKVIQTGGTISLLSNIILFLLALGGIVYAYTRKSKIDDK